MKTPLTTPTRINTIIPVLRVLLVPSETTNHYVTYACQVKSIAGVSISLGGTSPLVVAIFSREPFEETFRGSPSRDIHSLEVLFHIRIDSVREYPRRDYQLGRRGMETQQGLRSPGCVFRLIISLRWSARSWQGNEKTMVEHEEFLKLSRKESRMVWFYPRVP